MTTAISPGFNQLTINLETAQQLLSAASTTAAQGNWSISVAIVDTSGALVAFAKHDHAIGISPDVAIGKARTAALLQAPSGMFENFINQGQPSFLATPGTTPLEGGIPLQWQGTLIGAIGVSGAHGPNDTHIALQAAQALGLTNAH
ncbi:GlcG/HbpS family heme-binding protein [Aquitalea denitrificans]|uniref:GlcG/HbpS family heme-binding protein n=1 Tax=Aquitalea denitrificans TaxID=519081 RepID=UPI001358EBF0|nr:heme-binding protein [Aquitalea denitrificans]